MESLTCPKCHGLMRTYERSGITVDQCGDCRGIFLDRGELERLVDAEARFNAPPRREEKHHDDRRYDERRDERRYDDDRRYSNQQYPRKKKKSFLEDLFD
ncbi:zf-TFIIB domain-containing protein [Kribbella sp. NPDC004875]|uniref:TFIIB-type zinc ribbon-containing protein n=1 Tax=Kribbella sp. NPDC004875 TaxID=3364107 RepID=UPI0036CEFC44